MEFHNGEKHAAEHRDSRPGSAQGPLFPEIVLPPAHASGCLAPPPWPHLRRWRIRSVGPLLARSGPSAAVTPNFFPGAVIQAQRIGCSHLRNLGAVPIA